MRIHHVALRVGDCARAADFYTGLLGLPELRRFAADGGPRAVWVWAGDAVIMLADEHPEMGHRGPRSLGGSSVSIMLYLPDVDAVFERALKAGARAQRPVQNQFYGDRSGTLEDPFGHVWTIATSSRTGCARSRWAWCTASRARPASR